MVKLFSPLKLKNTVLPNRIVVTPMCQYSAINGYANDWHLVHLGQFAIGKAGTVVQEATAVLPEGRISYGDLGIWSDSHIEKYKQITTFIKSQGSIPALQLMHAGRKASTELPWIASHQISPDQINGWQTVSSSDLPFYKEDIKPISLTHEEISEIVNAYKQATRRGLEAGYEIIELLAGHGYLIHQFLSPLINKRQDKYGGSFENRIRFLVEIIEEVKPLLTNKSLWVRLSATDWAENGWSVKENTKLAEVLYELGVEVVDISSGGAVEHQQIDVSPGYQVPFAQDIKLNSNILVATVGMITSARQAEQILQENKADLVSIGREFLRDPHFVMNAAKELGVDLEWANQYKGAKS